MPQHRHPGPNPGSRVVRQVQSRPPRTPAVAGETNLYLSLRPLRFSALFAFHIFVIPDLIRDPGRQARMVRVALDARLRGRDEKVKVNRSARREGAKGAEVSRKALRAPFTRSRGPSG